MKTANRLLLLSLCLTTPLLQLGCDSTAGAATSAPVPPTSQTLWSSADVSRVLDDLRSIREQRQLLEEVRKIALLNQTAAEKTAGEIETLTAKVEGLEQRLDNPPAPVQKVSSSADVHCVNIKGVDYDLSEFISDNYVVPWTWDGPQTYEGLKSHLIEHGVNGIENLSFGVMKKLHAAIHEKEGLAVVQATGENGTFQLFGDVQPNTPPGPDLAVNPPPAPDNCPNGMCPLRSKTVSVTRTTPSSSSVSTRSSGYYVAASSAGTRHRNRPTRSKQVVWQRCR